MLPKSSVNVDNITKLADFIDSGVHPWGFSNDHCFIGNAAAAGIIEVGLSEELSYALGLNQAQTIALCFHLLAREPRSVWSAGLELSRSKAVSILRYLAATGKLPTEV